MFAVTSHGCNVDDDPSTATVQPAHVLQSQVIASDGRDLQHTTGMTPTLTGVRPTVRRKRVGGGHTFLQGLWRWFSATRSRSKCRHCCKRCPCLQRFLQLSERRLNKWKDIVKIKPGSVGLDKRWTLWCLRVCEQEEQRTRPFIFSSDSTLQHKNKTVSGPNCFARTSTKVLPALSLTSIRATCGSEVRNTNVLIPSAVAIVKTCTQAYLNIQLCFRVSASWGRCSSTKRSV